MHLIKYYPEIRFQREIVLWKKKGSNILTGPGEKKKPLSHGQKLLQKWITENFMYIQLNIITENVKLTFYTHGIPLSCIPSSSTF